MNKIDALIYEFRHRQQYTLLLGREPSERAKKDILVKELAKGDTFLLFGETFPHNRITKAAFIGLRILLILFLAAAYGFLLWEALVFLLKDAAAQRLVNGYHPMVQYILYMILAAVVSIVPVLLYMTILDCLDQWLPVSDRGRIRQREYFLLEKSFVRSLCDKYHLPPDTVLSRLEWRIGLKERPDGGNYFITILALIISIITLVGEGFLQVAFEAIYDWRMVFWTILVVGLVSFVLFYLLFLRMRKNYREEQYLFSILEEIVYCDKEMTEQDTENSDRQPAKEDPQ